MLSAGPLLQGCLHRSLPVSTLASLGCLSLALTLVRSQGLLRINLYALCDVYVELQVVLNGMLMFLLPWSCGHDGLKQVASVD